MLERVRRLIRRLRCKRHRWKPSQRRPGMEFCDLCHAWRAAPPRPSREGLGRRF